MNPCGYEQVAAAVDAAGPGSSFIVKPVDRGEGHGIFVTSSFNDIEGAAKDRSKTRSFFSTDKSRIVQPFMAHPMLIDGRKFDLRLYVLVTSISPLRVYLHDEGLVRFASKRYDSSMANGGNRSQFLTNTSEGKKSSKLKSLVWTLEQLVSMLPFLYIFSSDT